MKKTDVLKYFGGNNKVAAALGLDKSSVSQWGEHIPIGRAYQIELITKGKLKAESRSSENV